MSENRKAITFSDKQNIGTLKFIGTYDLNYYQLHQIKRVRLVKSADGYYAQFTIQIDLKIETQPTGKAVGLDIGIKYFLADSNGNTIENPRFYRKSENHLNRANRQKSKKYKKGVKPQSNIRRQSDAPLTTKLVPLRGSQNSKFKIHALLIGKAFRIL